MIIVSIKNKELLKIEDETNQKILYGSNQEWYGKWWQRMSGCGPSTAANILLYLNRACNHETYCPCLSKKECLDLMNEVWGYVKPGFGGVSSTGMLCKGFQKYLQYKNLGIRLESLDIPKKKALRPNIRQMIDFISKSLQMDAPVAFLNLENGKIRELDSWHWVTIISIEYDMDTDSAFIVILDGGIEKRIDLSKWLGMTRLGGGFVSSTPTR